MTTVICPACRHRGEVPATEAAVEVVSGSVYQAPYRCPKCLGLYFVYIENGELISCEPLTESGYARWKQAQDQS